MEKNALEVEVWKELAISKQMLMRVATDALGLDADCDEAELKIALEAGIQKITDANALVAKAAAENKAAMAAVEKQLEVSEQGRTAAEEKIVELIATNEATEALLEATRKKSADDFKKVNTQLEEKSKALKAINVALADTPENVVKKMKALNKKKFDETTARQRSDDEVRSLKKERTEFKAKIEKLDMTVAQSVKLAEQYRELQSTCGKQHEQLKPLVDDEANLPELPEMDEELLNSIAEAG